HAGGGVEPVGGAAAGAAAGPPAAAADGHAITSPRSWCAAIRPEFRRSGSRRQRAGATRTRATSGRSLAVVMGSVAVVVVRRAVEAPAAVPGALDLGLPRQLLEAFVDPGLGAA